MSIVGFPLLLIPLAIVNIIAFLMPGVSLGSPLFALPLLSGVTWSVTFNDALIAFGMLLLFFEVAKTAKPGGKYFTDHLLSVLLCAAATAEFLLLPQFGNSTFFLLTFLTFIDVISGLAIRMRQRGYVLAHQAASRRAKAPRLEPSFTPAPDPVPTSVDAVAIETAETKATVADHERPVDVHAPDQLADGAVVRDKPVTTAPDGSELVTDRPPEPHR